MVMLRGWVLKGAEVVIVERRYRSNGEPALFLVASLLDSSYAVLCLIMLAKVLWR